jgi:hypothetical protein
MNNRIFSIVTFFIANLFFSAACADYTEQPYLVSKTPYPVNLTPSLNALMQITTGTVQVAPGAQVKLKLLIPPGLNAVKFVPQSNSFQYGVKLGGSATDVRRSNGDSIRLYLNAQKSSEQYHYIYIDNSVGTRTFSLHPMTSLTIKAYDDVVQYNAWRNGISQSETSKTPELPVESANDTDDFVIFAANDLYHQIGAADEGWAEDQGWVVSTQNDQAGFLAYGPYVETLTKGNRTAHFTLMVDNVTADNHVVATLEVYDAASKTLLSVKPIQRQDFFHPLTYQVFSLPYTLPQTADKQALEFRVNWKGTSYMKLANVIDFLDCSTVDQCAGSDRIVETLFPKKDGKTFPATTGLMHQIGRQESGGWAVSTANDQYGYLAYGPYVRELPLGEKVANFTLLIDNNSAGTDVVATLEVYDSAANQILANREVHRDEFLNAMTLQTFSVPYQLTDVNHVIEFRVLWEKTAYMRLQSVSDFTQ